MRATRAQFKKWQAAGLVSGTQRSEPVPMAMNGWEQQFANLLEAKRLAGEIRSWRWNEVSLRITDAASSERKDRWHKPDFYVVDKDGNHLFYEVKGEEKRDGITRLMSAATRFRDHQFILARKRRGQWEYERIGGAK